MDGHTKRFTELKTELSLGATGLHYQDVSTYHLSTGLDKLLEMLDGDWSAVYDNTWYPVFIFSSVASFSLVLDLNPPPLFLFRIRLSSSTLLHQGSHLSDTPALPIPLLSPTTTA